MRNWNLSARISRGEKIKRRDNSAVLSPPIFSLQSRVLNPQCLLNPARSGVHMQYEVSCLGGAGRAGHWMAKARMRLPLRSGLRCAFSVRRSRFLIALFLFIALFRLRRCGGRVGGIRWGAEKRRGACPISDYKMRPLCVGAPAQRDGPCAWVRCGTCNK